MSTSRADCGVAARREKANQMVAKSCTGRLVTIGLLALMMSSQASPALAQEQDQRACRGVAPWYDTWHRLAIRVPDLAFLLMGDETFVEEQLDQFALLIKDMKANEPPEIARSAHAALVKYFTATLGIIRANIQAILARDPESIDMTKLSVFGEALIVELDTLNDACPGAIKSVDEDLLPPPNRGDVACDPSIPLCAMLQLAPDIITEIVPTTSYVIHFADIAAQAASVNAPRPTSFDDPAAARWIASSIGLAVFRPIQNDPEQFQDSFAFGLLDVDRTLTIGNLNDPTTFIQGHFDLDAIRNALIASGYQRLSMDGHQVYKIRDDYKIDFRSAPKGAFNMMNYAVVLNEQTLVFTASAYAMDSVFATKEGFLPSLATHPWIVDLLSGADADLTSVAVVSSASLENTANLVLVGLGGGGPIETDEFRDEPVAQSRRGQILAVYPETTDMNALRDQTTQAVATAVSNRFDVPYQTIFSPETITVLPTRPVIVIDVTITADTRPSALIALADESDLLFLP
jgi:hypothetical protein